MTLSDIARLFNIICESRDIPTGVSIDSRQVKPGHVFIALIGERFDGHDFIKTAELAGAVAIVCHRRMPDVAVPQWIVPDTLQALAMIAAHHRQQLDAQVIALTGSNGKTTVKDMIASILPKPAFATPGNLNNHVGVPLSVLQLQAFHRYAVFELGANHIGEIAHTVALVKPNVTLINNIAPAHIEGFGSIDGVARAKGEIHQGLLPNGVAVINDDDAYAHFWDNVLLDKKIIRFSRLKPAEVCARDIAFNEQGCATFTLSLFNNDTIIQLAVPGIHNVSNALAAASCTYALGIGLPDIVSGLSEFGGVSGRMTFLEGQRQATVIDDTYNANLRSVLTALDVLALRQGLRIFVFGDMVELGDWSEQHHREVGLAARDLGIDRVMTCGIDSENTARAFGYGAKHYATHDALILDLVKHLDAETTVLVKGSRSSAMERIVHRLTDAS